MQQPLDTRDAYSVEQFAVAHGISRSVAYLEIASGRLTARKVGARTLITREDAAAWRHALPRMSTAAEATTAA